MEPLKRHDLRLHKKANSWLDHLWYWNKHQLHLTMAVLGWHLVGLTQYLNIILDFSGQFVLTFHWRLRATPICDFSHATPTTSQEGTFWAIHAQYTPLLLDIHNLWAEAFSKNSPLTHVTWLLRPLLTGGMSSCPCFPSTALNWPRACWVVPSLFHAFGSHMSFDMIMWFSFIQISAKWQTQPKRGMDELFPWAEVGKERDVLVCFATSSATWQRGVYEKNQHLWGLEGELQFMKQGLVANCFF